MGKHVAAFRILPEVYGVLQSPDNCDDVSDELVPWLAVCEVEGLVNYTCWPEDAPSQGYSSLNGEPTALVLELTRKGRAALLLRD